MEQQVIERASKRQLKWFLDSVNPKVQQQAREELAYRKVCGRRGRQISKAQKRKIEQDLSEVGAVFVEKHISTPSENVLASWLDKAEVPYIREHVIVRTSNRLRQEKALQGQRLFIADFFLPEVKLIIEVDGGYHTTPEQKQRDRNRDLFMRNEGYATIRITNEQLAKVTSLNRLYFVLANSAKTESPKKRLRQAFATLNQS